jgi:hypothetical protein
MFVMLLCLPAVTANADPVCKVFTGSCGDIDGSTAVNISDAVFLVAYIFGGGPAPNPMWPADCDLNGLVNVADGVYLLGYIFGGGPEPCDGGGRLFAGSDISPYLDCLEYEFDGVSRLVLKHVNTCFNCCPQSISGYVTLGGSTLHVWEEEDFGGGEPCPCLCLFDLDIVRDPVLPGIYTIVVHEEYVWEGDQLEFEVDLTEACSGSYCVYRDDYPWGEGW